MNDMPWLACTAICCSSMAHRWIYRMQVEMDCAALVRVTQLRIIQRAYRDGNLLKFWQGGVMLFERVIQDVLFVAGNAA